MKGYCYNFLTLEGDESEINRFIAKTISKDQEGCTPEEPRIDFNIGMLLPYPEDLFRADDSAESKERLIKKYGYDDFDDWCIANWGAIDDCSSASYSKSEQILDFTSPKAPPDKAVVLISKLFPTLIFTLEYFNYRYEDQLITDFGNLECRDGEIVSERYRKVRAINCPTLKKIFYEDI